MNQRYTLKLAHINDTHSNFEASRVHFSLKQPHKTLEFYSHSGGYARIKYQVDQSRRQADDNRQAFVFLHGGDSFQGTLYYSQFNGRANAHLLSMLQPDAMVLGNHELDAGSAPITDFLGRINFPLLAGNMDLSRERDDKPGRLRGQANFLDYDADTGCARVLLKPLQDRTLAIIGITLDQMKDIAHPDADTDFIDAIDTTRRTVERLKSQGIDHIIVLSHLGLPQDRVLASRVDGISLIVGGHTHTLQGDFATLGLGSLPYGERVNDTRILQAGKYAETLGIADIEFDAQGRVTSLAGHNYFMLDRKFLLQSTGDVNPDDYRAVQAELERHTGILWDEEDADVKRTIAEDYRPTLDALENQVLGFVPRNLVHTRLPSKSLPHGSEIAPWVSRSMYHEARLDDHRIHFALHNAGGVRQSLNRGELTLADVLGRLLPFDLPLVKYQIQGQYLYQALESAINAATNNSVQGTGAGSFPYTYGLRYCYDGRRPLGERIVKLEILSQEDDTSSWLAVRQSDNYIGVSTAYTAAGKEGYHALLNAHWQETLDSLTLPGAFIRHIGRHRNMDEILSPQVHYTSHLADTADDAG